MGFAAGMERILMALQSQQMSIEEASNPDVFIVALGEEAVAVTQGWLRRLRENNLAADTDFLGRSTKAQFREANRQQAKFVLVLGDDEISRRVFSVKNMQSGEQKDITFDTVVEFLKSSC